MMLKAYASHLPSLQLSERSICDLELLATGGFSPLSRFMNRDDHQRVLEEMRLTSGHLFPIPVTLPVDPGPAIHLDQDVALRNAKNDLLAVMTIEEIYEWDVAQVPRRCSARSTCAIRWRRCTVGANSTSPAACRSCNCRVMLIFRSCV